MKIPKINQWFLVVDDRFNEDLKPGEFVKYIGRERNNKENKFKFCLTDERTKEIFDGKYSKCVFYANSFTGLEQANKITYESFDEIFKPIQNPFTEESSFDNTTFETYGAEIDYVIAQESNCIWTLYDFEIKKYTSVIGAGYHLVDRLGYFITEVGFPPELEGHIQVLAD